MSQQTFPDEILSALRGFVALLTGKRHSATYFDFSQRGLAGSFIALTLALVATAYGPMLLGVPAEPGAGMRSVILGALLFAMQIGAVYLVLRQIGRLDGLVPYLVADNWVNLVVSVLSVGVLVVLGPDDFVVLAIGLLAIIVEVNIARLIVTLAPLQIVMFMGAQLAAQFLGIILFGGMLLGPAPAV